MGNTGFLSGFPCRGDVPALTACFFIDALTPDWPRMPWLNPGFQPILFIPSLCPMADSRHNPYGFTDIGGGFRHSKFLIIGVLSSGSSTLGWLLWKQFTLVLTKRIADARYPRRPSQARGRPDGTPVNSGGTADGRRGAGRCAGARGSSLLGQRMPVNWQAPAKRGGGAKQSCGGQRRFRCKLHRFHLSGRYAEPSLLSAANTAKAW